MTTTNKQEELDYISVQDISNLDALFKANKKRLSGTIGEDNQPKYIPTISPTFNKFMGGVPLGKFISMVGNEQACKSTFMLMLARSIIEAGYGVMYIDAEMTMTKDYITACGIKEKDYEDRFRLVHTNVMEEVIWLVRKSTEDLPNIKLIIIDSLPSLKCEKEISDTIEDPSKRNVAASAYHIAQHWPVLKSNCVKNDVCLAYIRQYRSNIGVSYGNPNKESGGRALEYWTDIKLTISAPSSSKILEGSNIVGLRPTIKATKSKVGSVFESIELPFILPQIGKKGNSRKILNQCGIDMYRETANLLEIEKVVDKKGAYFKFTDGEEKEVSIQGEAKFIDYLRTNKEQFEFLKKKLEE